MSWIQKLCDTYDTNVHIAGKVINADEEPLLPLGHLFVKSHIEVTINEKGELLRAEFVGSEDELTITPCTEQSASRSGKAAATSPHILADKAYYFAGDCKKYGIDTLESYNAYIELLSDWATSESSHPMIQALYSYIRKGTLFTDLVKLQFIQLDSQGKLSQKWDKKNYPNAPTNIKQHEAIIRWRVEIPDYENSRLWNNKELSLLWTSYYMHNLNNRKELCQIYGDILPLTQLHPKNINPNAANAKIISTNDKNGYTYRGRLASSEEVLQISYEASQKAHNALRWLIAKQGYKHDKRAIVVWNQKQKDIIEPFDDGYGIFGAYDDEEIFTGEEVAQFFNNRLRGYSQGNMDMDKVFIISIEAVTDGRMTITYFREYKESDYIDRILKWNLSCRWIHRYRFKKVDNKVKHITFVGAPAPKDIIRVLYARPKDSDNKEGKVKEELFISTLDRILLCILEGRKIPIDIVRTAVRQVVNRSRYNNVYDFEKALSITCALINKYAIDYKKEEYKMALEKERTTRDYLYGRLLAVAQNIESWALKDSGGENRTTNADRLMQRFSQHPYTTWKTIELSLKPYLSRLKEKGYGRERLLDEIMNLFNPQDYINDRPLSGEFLIGYHCQRQDFYKKKEVN